MIFPARTIKLYCIQAIALSWDEQVLCCSSTDGASSLHMVWDKLYTQGMLQIFYTGPGTDRLHRAWDRWYTQGLGQMFYTGPWTELLALSFANKMFVFIQSEFVILYITVLSVFMKICDSFILVTLCVILNVKLQELRNENPRQMTCKSHDAILHLTIACRFICSC